MIVNENVVARAVDFEADASRIRVLGAELMAAVRSVQAAQDHLHHLNNDLFAIVKRLPVGDPRSKEFERLYIKFSQAMLKVQGGVELTLLSEHMKHFSGGKN